MLQELKHIIDSATSSIDAIKDDHATLGLLMMVDPAEGSNRKDLPHAFSDAIKQALAPSDQLLSISFEEIKKIEDAFVFEAVTVGCDNNYYIAITDILRGACSTWIPFTETDRWKEAVRHAKNYFVFKGEAPLAYSSLRQHRAKAFDEASAVNGLRAKGFNIALKGLEWEFGETGILIAAEIGEKIKKIGGLTVISSLTQHLVIQHDYIPEFNRYAIVSRLGFSPGETKQMIPFGYLMNMAVKHPYDHTVSGLTPAKLQQELAEIVQLATWFCSLYHVQPYSLWEVQFRSRRPFGIFLQEIALFDSIYTLPSCDPKDMLEIAGNLFGWLNASEMNELIGFTIEDYMSVAQVITSLSNSNGPTTIYLSRLIKLLPDLGAKKVGLITQTLSIPASEVNADFQLPVDWDKSNILFKPLIALSATKFCLVDRSWMATGFYEAIATVARKVEPRTNMADKQAGLAQEEFIKQKLAAKGIVFSTGSYHVGTNLEGECDLIIEIEYAILVVEMKKKALTRRAKGGRDADIIIDLAASMLDAQIQTGKVELLLLKQGFIELVSPAGQIQRIEHKGRVIERVAVTLHEFGAFQDRGFTAALLTQLVDSTIDLVDTKDTAMAKKFDQLKQPINQWTDQAQELLEVDTRFNGYPYHDCWFISLPQLLLLLKYSNDNESFYKALRSIKSVSLGSSNFYFEFLHCHVRQLQVHERKQFP